MEKNNTLLLLLILVNLNLSYSQEDFSCISDDYLQIRASGQIPDSYLYIPDSSTSMKFIRVSIHFILKSIGDSNYPGNFTHLDNGMGDTTYTGYDFAREYINMANLRLSQNQQMTLPPGNHTPLLEAKYRYVLDAVYFHENNNYYCGSSYSIFSNLGENKGSVINIFLYCADYGNTGFANMIDDRYVFIKGRWDRYLLYLSQPELGDGMWANSGSLNHEIGHSLSLHHTMMTNGGVCDDDFNDYCNDTPTRGEIIDEFSYDPCCSWSTWHDDCSNNLMDYGRNNSALTPCQLGRVHWTLENEMNTYQTCYLDSSLAICDFSSPKILYMGEQITVGGGNCGWQNVILQPKEIAHLIASKQVILNPGFEVKVGAEFFIEFVDSCMF